MANRIRILLLLLHSLTCLPFEPMKLSLDEDLTIKTCFLLALASSKRVSKLHGLLYRVSHLRRWHSCTFSFEPGFVVTTQNPSVPDPYFNEFSILSLHDFV